MKRLTSYRNVRENCHELFLPVIAETSSMSKGKIGILHDIQLPEYEILNSSIICAEYKSTPRQTNNCMPWCCNFW